MEVLSEGKNFRLVHENELPEIVDILEQYLPDSIKVKFFIFLNKCNLILLLFIYVFVCENNIVIQ